MVQRLLHFQGGNSFILPGTNMYVNGMVTGNKKDPPAVHKNALGTSGPRAGPEHDGRHLVYKRTKHTEKNVSPNHKRTKHTGN